MNANGTWTTAELLSWARRAGASEATLDWLSGRDQCEPAEAALLAARYAWRLWAAKLLPAEQLGWAATDRAWFLRYYAARRLPVSEISWAATDPCMAVRESAAWRMPVEQLAWARVDRSAHVREAAARRMRAAGLEVRPTVPSA
jgi:hypothetical protein